MKENWLSIQGSAGAVPLASVPDLPYARLVDDLVQMLAQESGAYHCTAYFAVPEPERGGLRFYTLVACDTTGEVLIASHTADYYHEGYLDALSARVPAMHVFEREIAERHGVRFREHPWDKPLRFSHDRFRRESHIGNYPFYMMESPDLHQVNVGPVHAGIIEPGAFRFLCDGERVLHLEIALGYQHRGVETSITDTAHRLRQMCLAESIAGDTAIGHATAMVRVMEAGYPQARSGVLEQERALALEMERIAMHIADTGALCMDMAYQTGHVACEALRTLVINAMQSWCGNRFGKGLVRLFGTRYRLSLEQLEQLESTVEEVRSRFARVGGDLLTTPSVLSRLEQVCPVTRQQVLGLGAVGMAARQAGLQRDIRWSHGPLRDEPSLRPVVIEPGGDLLARLKVRLEEVEVSYGLIKELVRKLRGRWFEEVPPPDMLHGMPADSLLFSLVEGWRGEICHAALTGEKGEFSAYKIVDPSVHNWMILALSVRGAQISDFPLSNKSFNLSYAGHDL